VDHSGEPHVFDGTQLLQSSLHCGSCKEPLLAETEECSWCRINDAHARDAITRDPFRKLAQYGLLNSYIQDMDAISSGTKKE
jgi:hypothetical protein